MFLHDYFNFQQQQTDLKEYLQLNTDNDFNYSQILIERYSEAIHVRTFFISIDLPSFTFFQIEEELKAQLNEVNELVLKFSNPSNDDGGSTLDRLSRGHLHKFSDENHSNRMMQLKELTNSLGSENDQSISEETQFNLLRSCVDFPPSSFQ